MTNERERELLNIALAGYAKQLREIEQKMGELRAQIGGKPISQIAKPVAKPVAKLVGKRGGKRKMSAVGRAAISAAQKKRWAAAKSAKQKAKSVKKAAVKQTLKAA